MPRRADRELSELEPSPASHVPKRPFPRQVEQRAASSRSRRCGKVTRDPRCLASRGLATGEPGSGPVRRQGRLRRYAARLAS